MAGRLRQPAMVVLGQGLQSATSFVTSVMLGRFAAPGELGHFVLGLSLLLLLLSLGDTLVATPFTYEVLRRRLSRARAALTGTSLLATLALGLAAAGLLILCAHAFPALALPWVPLSLVLIVGLVREWCRRWCYVLGGIGTVLASDMLAGGAQLAALAWFATQHRLDAGTAFWAMGSAALLSVLPFLGALRGRVLLRLGWLAPGCAAFLRYGGWLVAGGACQILAVQSYSWFLFAAADVRATGAFAACLTLVNLPGPLLVGVTNFARPRVMATFRDQGWPGLARQVLRMGLLVVPPVAVFIALVVAAGGTLLQAVYGPAFAWASGELGIAALSLLCVTVAAPIQLAMLAVGLPRSNLVFGATSLGVAVAVGLPLTLWLGLRGALLGNSLGALVATCVLAAMLARHAARRRRDHAMT